MEPFPLTFIIFCILFIVTLFFVIIKAVNTQDKLDEEAENIDDN